MLRIHGVEDQTPESLAAKRLAEIACETMPEIERENNIVLEIIPSVQCFGQRIQDIDLLVFFADYRNENHYITSNGNEIHSFCAVIEVKSHAPSSVVFKGAKCLVKYSGNLHDASAQSEGQKYSVKQYISKNNRNNNSPYIRNLIWLTEFPKSSLPDITGNIIAGNDIWADMLEVFGSHEPTRKVECFSNRSYLENTLSIFTKELEATSLDRTKLETITRSVLDRTQQQYADKLGDQLLIFRGRGGTGKTVRLIRAAYQVYDELGYRVLILTYNKALVADIQRLLTLLRVKNAIGAGGIAIRTIHSFMHEWLEELGIINGAGKNFLENYEESKTNLLEHIDLGAVTDEDIESSKSSKSLGLMWDLIMIDEAQDWPASERDIIYKLYGYKKVVIADGIDQFVRGVEHIDWRDNINKSNTQIVPLRKSLRLKASLCQAVGHFANKIEFSNWNLEPHPESYGGRVIIVFGNALSKEFHGKLRSTLKRDDNKPIDMLLCVPPSWVEETARGRFQSRVARQYRDWDLKVWDAVDPELRGEYPTSVEQYRIVQYDSCRGLEGWIVVCCALDEFFEHKRNTARFSDAETTDIFFDKDEAALEYAKKWIMIPLTRAIDTLVIHVTDRNSFVGKSLLELHETFPDNIEVYEF